MDLSPYLRLAERLDALPNGFPPAPDDSHLRLLEKLFTPADAELAAQLRMTFETPDQLAARIGGEPAELRKRLKQMVRRGLIAAGEAEAGLGYKLMPFVVGIYEMQNTTLDAELAALFEQYYFQAFGDALKIQPPVHRVIPVYETIRMDLEVRPFESAADIIASAKSWGVIECICRKQKNLIGQGCQHPLEVCLVMSSRPAAFDQAEEVRALTQQQALETLHLAAAAGLVHTVNNTQEEVFYICNCCTCSCGILRGMADLGLANVVARSAFVNEIEHERCLLCGECVERCQFSAITLEAALSLDTHRCTGCGVCILACPEGALHLVQRPEAEILTPPARETDWQEQRARFRKIDLTGLQ